MNVLGRLGTVSYRTVSPKYSRQIHATLVTDQSGRTGGYGKGVYPQNLASALFELLELAACRRIVALRDARTEIDSHELYQAGTLPIDAVGDYLRRSAATVPAVRFRAISAPATPDVWLPAAMYDPPIGDVDDDAQQQLALGYWSTNGYAAGMNGTEALLHAVNEVIERDAFSNFLLESAFGRPVGSSMLLGDGWLSDLKSEIERSSSSTIDVRIIPALAGTVAIAIGSRFDCYQRRLLGMGSSSNAAYAIERALLEYEEVCATDYLRAAGQLHPDDDNFGARALVENYPFLNECCRCTTLSPPVDQTEFHVMTATQPTPVAEQLATKIQILQQAGYPVLARTLFAAAADGSRDGSPTVVQAVVLGAEQFHVVHVGRVGEPIARLRTLEVIEACRRQR
ncbi:YcaO-like family protein [Mycobacterium simiae]|nr:YcaO-like family protein [Mycobacterium simiae]